MRGEYTQIYANNPKLYYETIWTGIIETMCDKHACAPKTYDKWFTILNLDKMF